ncbi:MAG: glycosyltransferase family protein [Candidatus Paceibacterota bacterium]|jgi:spore coat polysaccharide biosynthesis protein SpsF
MKTNMYKNRKEKIVATIEARMSSSRLPGKVLMPIGGVPALELLIGRLKRSQYLDQICVATTINHADDAIVACAQKMGITHFRGSETDVLGRVLEAAQSLGADIIVEITGDCPFVDPALVDRGIEEFFARDVDYASNTISPTYPNGFDVQVFQTTVLAEVASLTNDPIDRTHVSCYIYNHPERYRCCNWEAPKDSYGPELRVTLDEEADYQVLQDIFEAMKDKNNFSAPDVVRFLLDHPEVAEQNSNVRQKELYEL